MTDCKEVILRMVDYMTPNGFEYRIISTDPGRGTPDSLESFASRKARNITKTLTMNNLRRSLSKNWTNTTNKIVVECKK